MATPQWKISGDYFEACSCDSVCPCPTSGLAARPTKGAQEGDGQAPETERHAGGQLGGDREAGQLGAQHQHARDAHAQHDQPEPASAETLAERVAERALAHRGEPSGHLGEADRAERPEGHHPEEPEAELGARLHGGHDGADLQEPADARQDAEGDVQETLHGRGSPYTRR